MNLEKFEEGDKVLFNERKQPLEVVQAEDNELTVEGPKGGDYIIYRGDDDSLLYCKKGNKRYSSYVEDLRKIGEWKEEGDTWTHSKTDAEIRLKKNEVGFWTIKSNKIDLDPIELPKYGYSNKEFAEEDIQKLVKKNPEG